MQAPASMLAGPKGNNIGTTTGRPVLLRNWREAMLQLQSLPPVSPVRSSRCVQTSSPKAPPAQPLAPIHTRTVRDGTEPP